WTPPRWLSPILPSLVERIRWGPDRDALREHILKQPAVGAVRMYSDREIVDDPEHHPGSNGGRLRTGQLLVQHPLQPAVKVHPVGMVRSECLDRGRARVCQVDRPGS